MEGKSDREPLSLNEEEQEAVVTWAQRKITIAERFETMHALPDTATPLERLAATAFLAGYRAGRAKTEGPA